MTSSFHNFNIDEVLFLDIETIPAHAEWDMLDSDWQQLWLDKSRYQRERKLQTPEESYQDAGIYAEFGRVICISVGYFTEGTSDTKNFRVISYYGDNEKGVLQKFSNMLETRHNKPFRVLCAHNGKEFDFPYLCRRLLVNGIPIPELLDLTGKKPWEHPHLDTMEMWKFGDYKHYSSLRLLAKLLDIPTPKDDIDGGMVRNIYYNENDLPRIERYCKKDVVTVARVLLHFKALGTLTDEQIQWLDGHLIEFTIGANS
jgi:3'-5' exonuclease